MLQIAQDHLEQICIHAQKDYPQECCGLILGKRSQESKIVLAVVPTANSWSEEAAETFKEIDQNATASKTKDSRFSIAPQEMLRVQKQARDRSLAIIGVYHSHPDHRAVPSEFDRAIAWQTYSYLIVSVSQGKVQDWQSWTLNQSCVFQSEKIVTVT